jgi:hypothetical protein
MTYRLLCWVPLVWVTGVISYRKQRCFKQRPGETPLPPQCVVDRVGGNGVEPFREAGSCREGRQGTNGLEKTLLGHILGLFTMSEKAVHSLIHTRVGGLVHLFRGNLGYSHVKLLSTENPHGTLSMGLIDDSKAVLFS